jgi:hypothetical protein
MAAAKRGKPNWASGLTATTDARIARNATTRRGKRRGRYKSRRAAISWSSDLAYAAGLIATDGCLVGGDSIDLTSKDRDQVATFLRCVDSDVRIACVHRHDPPRVYYRAQVGNVALYDWLISIGIGPRKSFRLGEIQVPREFLFDLVRGLLDGDRTISKYRYTVPAGPHPYDALNTEFVSASRIHIDWLRTALAEALEIRGAVKVRAPLQAHHHHLYRLRYSKIASIRLLTALYARQQAPRLERKWRIWEVFRTSLGASDVAAASTPDA